MEQEKEQLIGEIEVIEPNNITQANPNQISEIYQEDLKQANVVPGTPVVIIHNDNTNNVNNQQTQVQANTQHLIEKNKWVAFFLCLFFGQIGAQYFYCGWIGKGFTMLILSFTGLGLVITVPWAVVNLIQILMGTFKVKDGILVS